MPLGRPPNSRYQHPTLITIVTLVAVLYFGRDFFLPLTLAILFVFLLAPLVQRLEKLGVGRVGAVITTTLISFGVCALLTWMLTAQVLDLANELPKYRDNLRAKITSLNPSQNGPFNRATETFSELAEQVTNNGTKIFDQDNAVKVEVVTSPVNAMAVISKYAAPILAPLGVAAMVAVFVIFILLQREDLRDRIIHLVAHGKLQLTTQALDEAGERVSRYLLAQLIVNVLYGVPVWLGLWWIGIPNAFLWGLLSALLRFLPYLGPWIAAAFPILISLAISNTWQEPLLTVSLFVAMEIISNNIVEPWLYGSSTGLSSIAIIVSAVFWTWLWGAPGLLVATPLTVCIAVLGKYIPEWRFLDVLLGDRPPIAPHERLYQRLLALDEIESEQIVIKYLKEKPDDNVWDMLFFPVLLQIDADIHSGTLEEDLGKDIHELFEELIAGCGTPSDKLPQPSSILLLPARNEMDELSALMLQRSLLLKGVEITLISSDSFSKQMVSEAIRQNPTVICICTASPSSSLHATWLIKKIHAELPGTSLIAACWSILRDDRRAGKALGMGANCYDHSFAGVSKELLALSRCEKPLAQA